MDDLDIAALRQALDDYRDGSDHGEVEFMANADALLDAAEERDRLRQTVRACVPALLDAAEERDRLRAMKDAEWEAAKHRYCDLPVSADSLDTARAFVLRWFGTPNKDQETDARELARMFDAVAKDAASERDALRAQRDGLLAAAEQFTAGVAIELAASRPGHWHAAQINVPDWDAFQSAIRATKEQP